MLGWFCLFCYFYILKLTREYGDELGSKSSNAPLWRVTWKPWRDSLSLRRRYLYVIENFLISLSSMCTCISLVLSPLVCSPNKIKLKKTSQSFLKILLRLSSLGQWHKCWKWQIWEFLQRKTWGCSQLLVTL